MTTRAASAFTIDNLEKSWPAIKAAREQERERRKRRQEAEPAARAARLIMDNLPGELLGARLTPSNLSAKEGQELYDLTYEAAWSARDPSRPAPTKKERRRYEQLAGKLAGDEGLFERKRREWEREAAEKQAREAARLPVRIPGLLLDRLLEHGGLSVADLGLVAALELSFENRDPIFVGASFTEEDGEPVMVVPGGWNGLRFLPALGSGSPDGPSGAGYVRPRNVLGFLTENDFYAVERRDGALRVTRGPRLKPQSGR